jgi:hypothetical protein
VIVNQIATTKGINSPRIARPMSFAIPGLISTNACPTCIQYNSCVLSSAVIWTVRGRHSLRTATRHHTSARRTLLGRTTKHGTNLLDRLIAPSLWLTDAERPERSRCTGPNVRIIGGRFSRCAAEDTSEAQAHHLAAFRSQISSEVHERLVPEMQIRSPWK